MADTKKPNQGAGTGAKTRERVEIELPRQYKVIFHNDDFTTMEFVTEVLRTVFHKGSNEAVLLMMKVHREGQAIVGVYTYDEAMTKTNQAINMARSEGFPLRVTCEPE
jgi:ATP-dependent Clp protease adaptor protein ClpS